MLNFFRKSKQQKLKKNQAITCAYLDLVGSYHAMAKMDITAHDWKAHALSIGELEDVFPKLTIDKR